MDHHNNQDIVNNVLRLANGNGAGPVDDVEFLGESSNGRKRRREENGGGTSELSKLQAKLRRLEGENSELKAERDFFQSRALAFEPNLTPSLVHTHEVELDWEDNVHDMTTPVYTVDGVEFAVRLRYKSRPTAAAHNAHMYFGGRRTDKRCAVTATIKTPADPAPRFVLMLCTLMQRHRFSQDGAQCSFSVEKYFDGCAEECSGSDESFTPTEELSQSKIKIRFTIVVQKLESPLGAADLDSTPIVVHGKEFRVSAAYLSQWSLYFRAYFAAEMTEKKQGVFPVKDADISADEFQEMLHVIFPTAKPITAQNYEMLLKLANRFEMPDLRRRVEVFLIDFSHHSINKAHLFRLAADKYDLQFVQAMLLHRWSDPELMKNELLTSHNYKKLAPVTQNLVNQHLAESSIYTFGFRATTAAGGSKAPRGCGHHSCTGGGGFSGGGGWASPGRHYGAGRNGPAGDDDDDDDDDYPVGRSVPYVDPNDEEEADMDV